MKIGFTGTQEGMTSRQLRSFSLALTCYAGEFHHGDCIGADAQAHDAAVILGFEPVIHPPDNPSKRAFKVAKRIMPTFPYLVRNKNIVDNTNMLIATPKEKEEQLRSGTWSTVRYARKKRRPITLVYPDGTVGYYT